MRMMAILYDLATQFLNGCAIFCDGIDAMSRLLQFLALLPLMDAVLSDIEDIRKLATHLLLKRTDCI